MPEVDLGGALERGREETIFSCSNQKVLGPKYNKILALPIPFTVGTLTQHKGPIR